MRKVAPNYKRLINSLRYETSTGLFWHTRARQGVRKNKPAGCRSANGYWVIQFEGIQYYAHHLAWYIIHKIWPKMIDHKNGVRNDNRLLNLRVVTSSQNNINRKCLPPKKSKLPKGVFTCTHNPTQFRAKIQVRKQQIHLGQFTSVEEASQAYKNASRIYFGGYASRA